MPLRPHDTEVTVPVHPTFTRDGLAQLLAIAARDAAEIVATLESPGSVGVDYTVKDMVGRVAARLGTRALRLGGLPEVTDLHRELIDRVYGFEREPTHREPTAEEIAPVLDEGLAFLYEREQPEHARISHFGVTLPLGPNRTYMFAPGGSNGSRAVVVVNARGWNCDGLATEELDRLAELLRARGHEIHSLWNGGLGAATGSVGLLTPPLPSVMRAAYPNRT